jgi:crotonobetainyl-CoA:carnitine CoA-transferase CaiB-like acyl-CoA transferase
MKDVLAEWGAGVITVEPSGGDDPQRGIYKL